MPNSCVDQIGHMFEGNLAEGAVERGFQRGIIPLGIEFFENERLINILSDII